MKAKQKWKLVLPIALIVLGLAGALYAGISLWQRSQDYKAAQDEYARLRGEYVQGAAPDQQGQAGGSGPAAIDVAALQRENPDCVAWLEVPGTNISYPVMQGADNDVYLRRTFDKSYLLAGSVFMDYRADKDFSGFSTLLYGHNMRDGSMFSQLASYLEADFLAEHTAVYVHTPAGRLTYRVLLARQTNVEDHVYQRVPPGAGQVQSLLADVGGAYTENDRFLILSTCADGADRDARTLLVAVLEEGG